MNIVYFEGPYGVVCLDARRIVGASECRLPTEFPSKILLDCSPFSVLVKNPFEDVQRRLMASKTE